MDKKQEQIFVSTLVRMLLKKILKSDNIDDAMPVSIDTIRAKFLEQARIKGFDFEVESCKNLCEEVFILGFFLRLGNDDLPERKIEESFLVTVKALSIPHYMTSIAFAWFKCGITTADTEKPSLSILYNLRLRLCEKFDIKTPAPLPSIEEIDKLFKNIDKTVLDEIDIDEELIESSFAQLAFQCGYLLALNMGIELDDELLDVSFHEVFGDILTEMNQCNDNILAYYLIFKEGYNAHTWVTMTKWSLYLVYK